MSVPPGTPLALDHLLFATPDVDETTRDLEERFGVAFGPGGRHLQWGTRNRILSLGDDLYLEVIGPDEEQPGMAGRRILDLDRLETPRLAWYAVRPVVIEETTGALVAAGFTPGEVVHGRRELPDGGELSWQMTTPYVRLLEGLVPIVIRWGPDSTHPGSVPTPGVSLAEFRIESPNASRLSPTFARIGLPEVVRGECSRLVATFDTPQGRVALSS